MKYTILQYLKYLLNHLPERYIKASSSGEPNIFYTDNQLHILLSEPLEDDVLRMVRDDLGYTVENGNQIIVFCEKRI